MSETETRRGYARGRERREEILAAADAAFARHGFRGASLATIADEVGLSQPGVLHHFPSKEHLLLEVLRYREERGLEYMERTVQETDSYAEALKCFEEKDFLHAAQKLGQWRGICPHDDVVLQLLFRSVRAMVEGPPAGHPVWEFTDK